MSFRKRSIKPNLAGAKRLAKVSLTVETKHELAEDQKASNTNELDNAQNSSTKQDTKKDVAEILSLSTVSSNSESPAIVKPAVKKLSKRVKLIPKLKPRITKDIEINKEHKIEVEIENTENNILITQKEPPDKNINDEIMINTSSNNSTKILPSPTNDINSVEFKRTSINKTDLDGMNKTDLTVLVSDRVPNGETENTSQKNSILSDTSTTRNRLPKRTKVAPKLTRRSANTKSTFEKIEREQTSVTTISDEPKNSTKDVQQKPTMDDLKTVTVFKTSSDNFKKEDNVNADMTSLIDSNNINSTLNINSSDKTKKLSKHIKVLPKIIERSKSLTTQVIDKPVAAVTEEVETYKNDNSKILENVVKTKTLKKEGKHVHFTEEFNEMKNLQLLSDIALTDSSYSNYSNTNVHKPEEGEIDAPENKEIESINNKDGNIAMEQSSQSESEMSTKLNFSRKKTFKPNLGARRRKRLSSFSAYSSCDEDDEDTSKKKKKTFNKGKTASKEDESKTEDSKGKKNITRNKETTEVEKENVKKRKKRKSKSIIEELEDTESDENNEEEIVEGEREALKKKKSKVKEPRESKPKCSAERDLSTLTMQELIYYRPKSFKTVELRSKKEPVENGMVQDLGSVLNHEAKPKVDNKVDVKNIDDEEDIIAPQIMINEDGEIVLNEESLTLKKKVDDTALKNNAVLYEDALSFGSHFRRKANRGKRWKIEETLRFYKALSQIGTDFTLMSQVFGRFTRNELKKKFKQEEKVNCDLVDRALSNRLPLNMEMFLKGKEEMRDLLETESEIAEAPNENDLDDVVDAVKTTNDENIGANKITNENADENLEPTESTDS